MHSNALISFVPILVIVYPVEIGFAKSCPRIVVEVKEADTTVTSTMATNSTARNQQNGTNPIAMRIIAQEEKEKLTNGMLT